MARDGLPAGLGLRDLGWHRLRDLTSPEHVWPVAGDAMTTEFPPLRSLDGFRGNLPSRLSSFVGRDAEVVEVMNAALNNRLITLVGPGGVGKTSLAPRP